MSPGSAGRVQEGERTVGCNGFGWEGWVGRGNSTSKVGVQEGMRFGWDRVSRSGTVGWRVGVEQGWEMGLDWKFGASLQAVFRRTIGAIKAFEQMNTLKHVQAECAS